MHFGASMLTVFPESELYSEILRGSWHEENETEKLEEMDGFSVSFFKCVCAEIFIGLKAALERFGILSGDPRRR